MRQFDRPASQRCSQKYLEMNKQTGEKFQRCGLKFSFQLFDILNGMEMTAEIVVGGEEQVFKLEN